MLTDIIKKEILDHLPGAKFIFKFIICSALILLSVYMGAAVIISEHVKPAQASSLLLAEKGTFFVQTQHM